MSTNSRLRGAIALLAALVLAIALAACGDDDSTSSDSGDTGTDTSSTLIQENPDNNGVSLTIGSKNFTEQFILCLLYTSPSPRDGLLSRMPSSA